MRLTLRLLLLALTACCRKKNCSLTDESVLRLWVFPWDCIVRFVGNDRYHAYMDLGRVDLILRIGWGKIIWKNNWAPFVRTADIQYRQPLRMFQRFNLRTRIIYWDEYHFWMEHVFERKGQILSIALSKNVAKGKKGPVATQEAIRQLKRVVLKPAPPKAVQSIIDIESSLATLQKTAILATR